LAGDMIVSKCKTWQWESGEKSKIVDYLPKNKQFLITRKVPCLKRAKSLEVGSDDENELDGDWVETHVSHNKKKKEEIIEDIDGDDDDEEKNDEDSVEDMSDYEEEENIEDKDESTLKNDKVMKTRTYDISITCKKKN
jgi:ubiquitin-like-conjugating enzyme ATG3